MSSKEIERTRSGFGLRLNLWFAAVVTGVSLAVFLVAYYLLASSILQKDREVILAQLEVYRTWYEQGGLAGLNARFGEQADSGKETFFVRVAGPEHAVLFLNLPRQNGALDVKALENFNPAEPLSWSSLPAGNHAAPWLVATTHLPGGGWLQVGKTTDTQAALLEHFRVVFGWVLALALLLGVVTGLLFTNRALRPIRQLIAAFQRVITTGEMDARIPPRSADDELSQLTRLFNAMLEKNGTLIRGMREALDNVAHDLRTPLTRLRNTAERALQGGEDAKVYRNALSDTLEESERVSLMLNTLMDISEAETGIMKLEKTDVKVADLVAAVVGLYELVAEDKQIKVTINVPEAIHCFADRGRLQQVLVNLLDNALKYTAKGGEVDFSAEERVSEAVITVRDTGMGIAAEDIPRIWERLYRGDKSRTERGLGLGLSLVKAIVQAHGGRVEVESQPGKGSTFRVRLPTPALRGTSNSLR
jgi:signal transduction histidine kinase